MIFMDYKGHFPQRILFCCEKVRINFACDFAVIIIYSYRSWGFLSMVEKPQNIHFVQVSARSRILVLA